MLTHELLRDKGILLIRPSGAIQAGDFESVAKVVDPYIEQKGGLRGVLIEAAGFPGWDSFAALVSHLRFVRDHHRAIAKIAAVSDSAILSIAPHIAKHFVKAEFRHFDGNQREAALAWLGELRAQSRRSLFRTRRRLSKATGRGVWLEYRCMRSILNVRFA